VVGGEPTLPEAIAAALEIMLGCRARTQVGGALDAASRWRPVLVVADLDALREEAGPLLTGLATAAPGAPVLGLRAPGWRQAVGLAPVGGCAGYVDRPFALADLVTLSARLLAESRAASRARLTPEPPLPVEPRRRAEALMARSALVIARGRAIRATAGRALAAA
jgi:DNA-binding NtrC family response regulator